MAKMREFTFWNESGDEKKTEQLSFKDAVKAVQGDFKDNFIVADYISKKGKKIIEKVKIPMGRKKKIGK